MTAENRTENLEESIDTKKRYLAAFIAYRNDYIDDLPPKRLLPGDPNYLLYKCRGNCFVGVMSRINRLVGMGVITNPTTITKVQEFNDYMRQRDWSKFSTQADIDRLNTILDDMISELS